MGSFIGNKVPRPHQCRVVAGQPIIGGTGLTTRIKHSDCAPHAFAAVVSGGRSLPTAATPPLCYLLCSSRVPTDREWPEVRLVVASLLSDGSPALLLGVGHEGFSARRKGAYFHPLGNMGRERESERDLLLLY